MGVSRRVWLMVPTWLLMAADVALTLAGQTAAYWAGDHAAAVELNPVALVLLAVSPWLFVGLAVAWAAALGAGVLWWRHPCAEWLAVGVAFGHALGGSSWLIRLGPWGWFPVVGYLVLASQLSRWCWRRSGWLTRSNK